MSRPGTRPGSNRLVSARPAREPSARSGSASRRRAVLPGTPGGVPEPSPSPFETIEPSHGRGLDLPPDAVANVLGEGPCPAPPEPSGVGTEHPRDQVPRQQGRDEDDERYRQLAKPRGGDRVD